MAYIKNNRASLHIYFDFDDYVKVMKHKDPKMDQSTFLRNTILKALDI